MIQVKNLFKVYKNNIIALNDLTIDLPEGNIIAILGLNGSGKSTFTKILLGLVKPTSGHYNFKNNSNLKRIKFSYLPENFSVEKHLKIQSLLKFLGNLYGYKGNYLNEKIDYYLNFFEMYEYKNKKIETLSKGMNIKVGLIQAFLNEANYYFLDEPTDGLDPIMRLKIRGILKELKSKGATIIINSHILSEVELFADKFAILHKGKLLKYASVEEVTQNQHSYEVEISDLPKDDNINYSKKNKGWTCTINGIDNLKLFIDRIDSLSIKVLSIKPVGSTLEDFFNSLIMAQK